MKKPCAYCGDPATTADHVVSKGMYHASSAFHRITVPACLSCNNGMSDDEVHFRTIMLLAGNTTPVVRELWDGKTRRSFDKDDGRRRVHDVFVQMVPTNTDEGERHMVFPARDPRVMRVVRKIIRGLCAHHRLRAPVSDAEVVADVQRFQIPELFYSEMTAAHADPDVLQYRYLVLQDDPDIHSGWSLTFYSRTSFFCTVFRSLEARDRFEKVAAEVAPAA